MALSDKELEAVGHQKTTADVRIALPSRPTQPRLSMVKCYLVASLIRFLMRHVESRHFVDVVRR